MLELNEMYQVMLNNGLNLGTASIETAKARAYDLLVAGHKNVRIDYPEVKENGN